MKNFSNIPTKTLFALAISLMLVSCGGSDSASNSNADVSNIDSVNPPVVKPIPNEKVVYVCADGKTGANGLSWDTCTTKIQDAIKQAQDNNKDLWFKVGNYILTETITLDKDVKLFGGFKGTESKLQDRKLDTNATILSGDKKVRVLKTEHLTEKSTLDGFVITQGQLSGNGAHKGAGMYNINSDILIKNVIFSENIVEGGNGAKQGGAMYNDQSSPTIINTTFSKNEAVSYGGAIYNNGSNPKLINVTIANNIALQINSGIHNNNSSPIIKNSIIWAKDYGIWNNPGTPNVNNSIIKNANLEDAIYKNKKNKTTDPLLTEVKVTIDNISYYYYTLAKNSPAIDAGNSDDNNETTDQVGNKRKNGTIDIGAVEKQ